MNFRRGGSCNEKIVWHFVHTENFLSYPLTHQIYIYLQGRAISSISAFAALVLIPRFVFAVDGILGRPIAGVR